ncbi:MAG: glutamate-cysteine ligase family protein [Eggerthellaceae bacterium]|nr:glutamate-cysteine ligase family protein [Eggerthellaceae bacterium]
MNHTRTAAAAGEASDQEPGRVSDQPSCQAPCQHAGQPARKDNVAALVACFESGITAHPEKLGIELEHIIVRDPGLAPVGYTDEQGVRWLLEQLRGDYPQAIRDADGDILGLTRPGEAVTLEPAGQLELSAGPFTDLAEASACFDAFSKKLARLLAPVGQRALLVGYHPTAVASELELIPKRRYKFMNYYLGDIGAFGPRMMRGSASTQVSIDYSSVEDCLRKLRLAFACVPVFSLITDNAPVFEGKARPHKAVRTKIWLECDPDRCGLVPGVMDRDFTLERYAEYVLDTPAILVPCSSQEWCYSDKAFGDIYADTAMERADVEHALSMFFNDVRLKTYIEIRPADAMPIPFVIAYAALIRGLFYSEASLDALDELFADVDAGAVGEAKERIMAAGYEAEVYGQPVAEVADRLMTVAKEALDDRDRRCLAPLDDLVSRRRTLADEAEKI